MKWIFLIGMTLLASACVCSSTEVVEYRQVSVAPAIEPVVIDGGYPGIVNVTHTAIDFY